MSLTSSVPKKSFLTISQEMMTHLQSDIIGFKRLSNLLKTNTGINLIQSDKNLTLMASRLISILMKYNFSGYSQYLQFLSRASAEQLNEFTSALTTNTTQFFREPTHFDLLKDVFPSIIQAKTRQHIHEVRIWCNASSTGQEIYTVLMTLQNQIMELKNWGIKILATDIDPEVLEKAATGIYSETDIKGVPQNYRKEFFNTILDTDNEKRYQVKGAIRHLVRFAPFNLLSEPYPFQHKFDIIFCRNVLIYFDRPTSERVISKLEETLNPGGVLFLGHSETGTMNSKKLKAFSNAAYRKQEND